MRRARARRTWPRGPRPRAVQVEGSSVDRDLRKEVNVRTDGSACGGRASEGSLHEAVNRLRRVHLGRRQEPRGHAVVERRPGI